MSLAALPVALPFLVAALLMALGRLLPSRWPDLVATLAAFIACLFAATFVFGWGYFDEVGVLFHVLMLIFLGAMAGFCMSGDIFNLFVFFELMGVTAFALTGYKLETSTLEGALNFTVTNTLGGFLLIIGIALLYGRTGALNLAQIGRAIGTGEVDALILMAFVLLMGGFFVKAAVAPFHFWLPDAHAVAPTPVCVLFSGAMVALGVFGAARIYWTVFAGRGLEAAVRDVLLGLGVLTAVLGAVMCFVQRHVKRLLAFSTISHMGTLLVGVALLTPQALAGSALYLVGHGLAKAALFMGAGILLSSRAAIDELTLRGRGGDLPLTGGLFVLAGLTL